MKPLKTSLLLLTLWAPLGCQMAGPAIKASPWNYTRQEKEIEKLAPLGTPREEAERRLRDAGLVITPGTTKALAYCDMWNRPDGDHWTMNVTLQYDEEGKLIGYRPAQAETGVVSGKILAQAPERPVGEPQPREQISSPPATEASPALSGRRRSPFQEAPTLPK